MMEGQCYQGDEYHYLVVLDNSLTREVEVSDALYFPTMKDDPSFIPLFSSYEDAKEWQKMSGYFESRIIRVNVTKLEVVNAKKEKEEAERLDESEE